jgi:glycine cleavage system H protein
VAADETYPADLRYHREHDWVRVEGDEAVFGITWFAQDALGEVVYYDPPAVGATVARDASYGELESVKAVSDIIAPASGEVTAVNAAVSERPEVVNDDPYGDGWLIRVRLADPAELDDLMDEAAYRAYLSRSPE